MYICAQVSSSERMRRQTLAKELRKMLQSKPKSGGIFKHDTLFEEIRAQSQVVNRTVSHAKGYCYVPHNVGSDFATI